MANAAKNTTHGAEEAHEAAQKLSKMASELRTLVAQFNYAANGTDRPGAPNGGGSPGMASFRRAEKATDESESFIGTVH